MPRLSLPAHWPVGLKQTLRVSVAVAVTFAAYKLLGLQQGYWAVFTVLIVMQSSIGSTISAAIDRMMGTFIGAALGGFGAAIHDGSLLGTGLALVLVTGIGAFVVTLRPQLRIAPVTASIMLLTTPPGLSIGRFVVDRVIEIGVGGIVGVLAMTLIFPARSQAMVKERAATTLGRMQRMLAAMARSVASGAATSFTAELIALRAPLSGIEQALKEADREHAVRLSRHAIPPAVPRTLWRVRTDLVLAARALDPALPAAALAMLGEAIVALLEAEAAFVGACVIALQAGTHVDRGASAAEHDAFAAAFDAFRAHETGRGIDFDGAGRLFGLSFALEELHRDLADLADRIDEMAKR